MNDTLKVQELWPEWTFRSLSPYLGPVCEDYHACSIRNPNWDGREGMGAYGHTRYDVVGWPTFRTRSGDSITSVIRISSVFVGVVIVDNDTTGDGYGRDLHEGMTGPARPGLEIERRKVQDFVWIIDAAGLPADEHTPAFAHGLIDTIDLKPDHRLFLKVMGLREVGADDDVPIGEFEINGKGHGSPFRGIDNTAHPSRSQVGLAMLLRQSFERRMPTRSAPAWCASKVSSLQRERTRVQGERDEIQGSGTQAGIGAPLEVSEVGGIDAGPLGQVFNADAEFILAMEDPSGQVAGPPSVGV